MAVERKGNNKANPIPKLVQKQQHKPKGIYLSSFLSLPISLFSNWH
jgi:hypothetical protein